jgi:hypothetical protein
LKEEQLIFIISQPRSGSTYLQNLLSNNTEVNTCSEPWVLLHFANQIKPELVNATFNNKIANKAFQDYLTKYPEIQVNAAIKNLVLDLYAPMAKGFNFVIDKTPRYWELLEEIVALFPKSKIIILKRNPVDVITSIIKTWNVTNLFTLNEFRRDLLLAPKQIHAFCEKNKNNRNVYTLRYEDFTANPTHEVKKLYDWIGIPFTAMVLNAENNNKHKGKYGDPYQNATVEADVLIKDARKKEIAPDFDKFITGYTHYLSTEFLSAYGGYSVTKGHPTKVFNDFMAIKNNLIALNKELLYLKKSTTYNLGKWMLTPFQFIKKMFR